ncbi:hypothetical protein EVAR_8985_1 [Eumeta japonica]|uniref:Uncharacterized protein n=1 Tax=Eumeta variegata TaxID=151549 RepID=A0A4C1WP94_EUMVA|nr:hypothetical protein EVAR_8985_1 [Eumeta japonica]
MGGLSNRRSLASPRRPLNALMDLPRFQRGKKAMVLVLASNVSSAPVPRVLAALVSVDTTGLELPTDFLAGTGDGGGAMQIVINIHTDSAGNIEISTN